MKKTSIVTIQVLFFFVSCFGQNKLLTGKIIDKFGFRPIAYVVIDYTDTMHFTTTDFKNGEFAFQVPNNVDRLTVRAVGYEQKIILLNEGCSHLDIILEQRPTNCFMTLEESDQSRLKEFKKLIKLHREAYDRGIFRTEQPCYRQKFVADSKWKRFEKVI